MTYYVPVSGGQVGMTGGALACISSGAPATPDWPRVANYSIGNSFNWENAAVQTMAKRCIAVIPGGWDGWQSGHTPAATWQAAVRSGTVKNVAPVFCQYVDMNFQTSTAANNGINTPATNTGWWLNDALGSTITTSYAGVARMLNFWPGGPTKSGSPGNGLTAAQYLVQWYIDWAINGGSGGYAQFTNNANPNLNGIYFDDNMPNLGAQYPSWLAGLGGGSTDYDRDSVGDSWGSGTGTAFTASYRSAQIAVYNYFKSQSGKISAGNMANYYSPYTTAMNDFIGVHDVGIAEHHIGSLSYDTETAGFATMVSKYQWIEDALIGLKYVIVCHDGVAANGSDGRTATAYQAQRYGLAFTCVCGNGGYFPTGGSAGSYSPSTDQALLFDEMNGGALGNYNYLGQPVTARQSTAWQNGVYRREFANGFVFCNPIGNGSQTINFGLTLTHLNGSQDPSVNDGTSVTSATMPDRSGLFMLK